MNDQTATERPDVTCCGDGKSWQPKAGEPLIHACQLCPNSPTYWRKGQSDQAPGARLT